MGFYGNITNTSKTNFVFDKIYTNRTAMDNAQRKTDPQTGQQIGDGVFVGRYVLVEYGEITEDSFIRVYGPKKDGYYHISNDNEAVSRILYTTEPIPSQDNYIKKGQIIYVLGIGGKYEFLECNGGVDKGKPAFAENPGLDPKTDPYFYNLKQDQTEYNVSRGYDGTVWVKTSVNNEIKYVNIAELNSVVPSFDMVADAPTMSPILPHFDTASNNVYYKLHWQPAWGMRIAETTDGSDRFSDYITSWSQEVYNKETGEIFTQWYFSNELQEDGRTKGVWRPLNAGEQPPTINADIYFNHAAFDSQVGETNINKIIETNKAIYKPITLTAETYKRNKYYYKAGSNYYLDGRAFNINRTYYEKLENYIGITADGLSGNKYNLHDGTSDTKQKPDTQQIHINLPAIGNMMSEAWDIIHGAKRDNSTVDSLQGRLNFFKDEIAHNEIPVQSSESEGYLVGSVINGAISYEESMDNSGSDKSVYNNNILEVETNSKKQYEHDDAWIATSIDTNQGKDGDKDYHRKAISIHHTFHKRDDSAVDELNINDYDGESGGSAVDSDTQFQKIINKDTIQLYVPKVDKAGHVVGTDIDKVVLPYGYKHIETIGNKISNETTDLDTAQDKLSNDKGTLTAGTPIGATNIVANETQDTVNIDPFNKWIQIKASDDKVEIAHEIHGIITKDKALTDLNDGTDSITIQDIVFDAAGHVTHNQKHEYELPYGFKHFTTNGRATSTNDLYTTITQITNGDDTETKAVVQDNQKSCVANNTQDTLHIATGNKWIQTKITNNTDQADSLIIAHEVHAIKDSDAIGTNLNGGNATNIANDNIVIPDLVFDKAGHLIENHSHKYTLPYGFKTVTVSNSTSATAAAPNSTTATSEIADNTQDTLQLSATNRWIKMKATGNDNIQFGHELSTSDIQSKATADTYHASSDTNVTNFGDSFNILKFKTDEAGHITAVAEDTVTIPAITFTNDTTGNVVTNMAYSYNTGDKKGTFTETRENIGTLALGTHTGTTITTNGLNILSSDTISGAFNKTQTHINNLILNSTDSDLEWITDVTQTNGQVAIVRKGTNNLKLNNYSTLTSVSTMDLASQDTLNNAFGKLEYRIKEEEKNREAAITALKVEDTANDTKYVSGVSETDGKIIVSRAGTDTLQLSNYSIATTGSDIKNNDTINEAFGKLQKQIKNIYNNEEIAENFDSIKEISDWLKANDSNADAIIDGIAILDSDMEKLNGDETVDGSIKKSITDAIADLDSSVAVSNNSTNYLTGITIVDGKITDKTEGTLGSAAFTESTNYATADQGALADTAIQLDTEIVYKIQKDNGEGNIVEEELKTTIEEMAKEIESLKQILKDNGLITE